MSAKTNASTKLYTTAMSNVELFPIDGRWLSLQEIIAKLKESGIQVITESTPVTAFKYLAADSRWETNNSKAPCDRKYRPCVPESAPIAPVVEVPVPLQGLGDESLVNAARLAKITDRIETIATDQKRLVHMFEALCKEIGAKVQA